MVPEKCGYFPKYREVTGTPRGVYGPYWALVGERRRQPRKGRPPKHNPNWEGGGPPFLPPSLLLPSSPTPTWKGESYSRREYESPRELHREGRPSPSSTPLYTGEGGTP